MALASVRVGTAMRLLGADPGTDARGGAAVPLSAAARRVNRGGLPRATVMLCLGHGRSTRPSTPSRRIERALARIEAAARRPQPAGNADDSGELERLRDAHQTLRSRVEGAIGQIDRLLETEGQADGQ